MEGRASRPRTWGKYSVGEGQAQLELLKAGWARPAFVGRGADRAGEKDVSRVA